MQDGPNVFSSDLDEARAISRRLRAGEDACVLEPPPFGLHAEAPLERQAAHPLRQARDLPAGVWETESLGSRFWNELLNECIELSRDEEAIAAFAVDGQGLCIAQVGDMDPDAVEGTGSRLVIALEQADRMESFCDRRLGALLIQFDDQWLSSMLLRSGSGSRVIVGVIAAKPLPEASRDLVAHLLGEALLRG